MKRLVVLGSGRSATSLVAKGLHDAGVKMGDRLIGRGPSNPHGHFEDRALVRLNDEILRSCGGSWYDPPPITPEVAARASRDVEAYIAHRDKHPGPWGMKDPRLCLTWPAWEPHLRALPELVIVPVWRSPIEIEASYVAMKRRPAPGDETHPSRVTSWRELAEIYQAKMIEAIVR